MKRQNAASQGRIKRPGPAALIKSERMLYAQSKPVNEPPFRGGFLLHSANFGFALRGPRSPSAPSFEHGSMENTLRNNRYSACLLYGNDLFQQDMSVYSGFVDFSWNFSKHSGKNSDVKNRQIFKGWRERTRGNLSPRRKICKRFFGIGKIWQNGACRDRTISLTVS